MSEQTLETASSRDGERRWVLRCRSDGRFDYTELRLVDLRPDGQVNGYWEQSYMSGIFETVREARNHALKVVSWLPGQL